MTRQPETNKKKNKIVSKHWIWSLVFTFATKKNTGTSLFFVEVVAQTPKATAQTNATAHAGSFENHFLKCAFSVQIAPVWLKLEVGLGFQGSPRHFCLDFSFSNYFCFQKLVFDPTGEVGFACFML
jgi:hypothetical protein